MIRFRHPRIRTGRAPGSDGEWTDELWVDSGGRILPRLDGREGASASRTIELPGEFVVPGFIDTHAHLSSLGGGPGDLDLRDAESAEALLATIAGEARDAAADAWIRGTGWQDADWPDAVPSAADLERASGGRPVALFRRDRHALIASETALRIAGIDSQSADPPGGHIERDALGCATGLLVDTAMDAIAAAIPEADVEALADEAAAKQRHFASLGVTCVHEAWVQPELWAALSRLVDRGAAATRVRAMLGDRYARAPETPDRDRLHAIALKAFADGALGSRGAQLSRDYRDAATRGIAVDDDASLDRRARQAVEADLVLAVHAIGDRAVTRVLDVFERHEGAERGWRIEHAQIVNPDDMGRWSGVSAAVQPCHCLADGPWAEARLGSERLAWSYRVRSLREAGARIGFGSDYPIETADPRVGVDMACADAHPAVAGWGRGAERITRYEALEAYWGGAAQLSGEAGRLGRLEPSHFADFVCCSADPVEAPATSVQFIETWVAGERVYAAPRPEGEPT